VFFLVVHHVPVGHCADITGALTGTRPSDRFVHHMPARAARAVRDRSMKSPQLLTQRDKK
jgi:transposase